jgi:glutamate---cysteine ligase / carboxylate-amine ligase
VPATELIEGFLTYLGPALKAAGDTDQVPTLVRETLARGTGSTRQRRAFARRGRLTDVVDQLVTETAGTA